MNLPAQRVIHVAVGVIINACGEVLIAKRPEHVHQGGLWEFPGGKVEPAETLVEALTRELAEEINITVKAAAPLMQIRHHYGDKAVLLDIWRVVDFNGEPKGHEGQPIAWCPVANLNPSDFPAANVAIIERLQRDYGLTPAGPPP